MMPSSLITLLSLGVVYSTAEDDEPAGVELDDRDETEED
jgi:hypothetical protein